MPQCRNLEVCLPIFIVGYLWKYIDAKTNAAVRESRFRYRVLTAEKIALPSPPILVHGTAISYQRNLLPLIQSKVQGPQP